MQTAYINRVATAVPPYDVHEAFRRFAQSLLKDDRRNSLLFQRMAHKSGIEHRYSCLAPSNLAESDRVEIVENNVYFPPESIRRDHVRESATHSTCPWKGLASYYDVVVGPEVNKDAAWYYPAPKDAAKNITNYVAFWRGVAVER